jgi:tetratricopeptide (TPR) repeat protein
MAVGTPGLKRNPVRLLVCLLCLQACTVSHQSRQVAATIPDNLPPAFELVQTPFIPQTEHQCGPAALATVLRFHEIDVTAEQLTPYLYLPERKGSLQIEMTATARRFGMLPYRLEPRLDHLLQEIAAGNPVLVLQNLRFDWWPQWHYAVVIGYDVANSELILRSGDTERWSTTFDTFAATWQRADNWALVVVPTGTIPATAQLSSFLSTAYALEETGLAQHAIEAYRSAALRWSNLATAWLALGNLAYATGDSETAVGALYTAARLSPDDSLIWNNLAYALHQSGCKQQALESLQCARRLSPDDQNIRDSEQEIENMPVQVVAKQCPEISCN